MNEENKNTAAGACDKRKDYRIHRAATVFIEVAAESFDGSVPAEILISNSVDLSANGLQITADQPLIVNSIHQAAIQLQNQTSRIALILQVKWVRFDEPERQYHIGLEALDDSDSGLANWKMDLSLLIEDDIESD